jgi:hypothetical protein
MTTATETKSVSILIDPIVLNKILPYEMAIHEETKKLAKGDYRVAKALALIKGEFKNYYGDSLQADALFYARSLEDYGLHRSRVDELVRVGSVSWPKDYCATLSVSAIIAKLNEGERDKFFQKYTVEQCNGMTFRESKVNVEEFFGRKRNRPKKNDEQKKVDSEISYDDLTEVSSETANSSVAKIPGHLRQSKSTPFITPTKALRTENLAKIQAAFDGLSKSYEDESELDDETVRFVEEFIDWAKDKGFSVNESESDETSEGEDEEIEFADVVDVFNGKFDFDEEDLEKENSDSADSDEFDDEQSA